MKCPLCTRGDSKVIDTRAVGGAVRRRRECKRCRQRFTTYERMATINLLVVKRDGRREEFDREKMLAGLMKACAKRPVPAEALENLTNEVEGELYSLGEAEVESQFIGGLVMERLRRLDDVAYVRFASVYRDFRDLEVLGEEIRALKERKDREEQLKRQLPLAL